MDLRSRFDELRDRYLEARTDAEREAVFDLIRAEMDKDVRGVAQAALEQIIETNEEARALIAKEPLAE